MAREHWRIETVTVRLTKTEKAALEWARERDNVPNSTRLYEMAKAGNLTQLVDDFLFTTGASGRSQNRE